MSINQLSIHGVKGIEIKELIKLMGGGVCRDIIIHTSDKDCDDFEISLFAWGKEADLTVKTVEEIEEKIK